MFKITNGEKYSLKEIHKCQKEGDSLLRSAHVGNFNPSTLFLAQEGFPIILHEHIKGDAKGYKPAFLKIGGEEFLISDNPELPLTHLKIRAQAKEKVNNILGRDFLRPSQLHYETLSKLFPKNINLASQFFFEQEPFFGQAMEVLSKEFTYLFENYVNQEGKIYNLLENNEFGDQTYNSDSGEKIKIKKENISELAYQYLQQTIDSITKNDKNPEGLIMKSNLYILLSSICEVYKGRNGIARYNHVQDQVIHFSGAEMINYLIRNGKQAEYNQKELNAMYETLRKTFGNILPETLEFRLVPTEMLGHLITDDYDIAEKYNDFFVANRELKKNYKERQELRRLSTDKIKQQVLLLDEGAIKERVLELYNQISELPGRIKKKISDANNMLENFEMNRKSILGILVSAEIAVNDEYSKNVEADKKIREIKNRILEISSKFYNYKVPATSQYDILENNVRLYFPESARELSQRELRDTWDFSVKEYSKEIKQEITAEEKKEMNNEYKPKFR